jgi:hypothetical protein
MPTWGSTCVSDSRVLNDSRAVEGPSISVLRVILLAFLAGSKWQKAAHGGAWSHRLCDYTTRKLRILCGSSLYILVYADARATPLGDLPAYAPRR